MIDPTQPSEQSADPVEETLAYLAGISPTPAATERAIQRTEAALATLIPSQRVHRRWFWPVSIAAASVAIATLAIFVMQTPVSAQQAIATTLQASQGFKGWIHMTSTDENGATSKNDWNTDTGASATRYLWGKDMVTHYSNPRTGETVEHHAGTNYVLIGEMSPEAAQRQGNSASLSPQTINDSLLTLRDALGQDEVKVAETNDGDLRRFDITITKPPPELGPEMFSGKQLDGRWFGGDRPSAIWIDPKTNLVVRATVGERHLSFSYGAPEINSIYDAGAPRDAMVFDCRATPQAAAVYDRVRARPGVRFPEGVVVVLEQWLTSPVGILTLYARKGENWTSREYQFNPNLPEPGKIQIPGNWRDTGTDELLHRAATIFPRTEYGGDGVSSWTREYKIDTGEIYVSYGSAVMGPDDKGIAKMRETKNVPGEMRETGQIAKNQALLRSPARLIYPGQSLSGRFGGGNFFETVTSPDRPGLVAVRTTLLDNSPDIRRAVFEDWIDPMHNDRAVAFLQDSYTDNRITGKTVIEFGEYATLPAPDNRSYPTTWTNTYSRLTTRGNFVPVTQSKVTLHYFPGRTLPEIPKKPTTAPAASTAPATAPATP